MRKRDELGTIYDDQMFASTYPARGQPANPNPSRPDCLE